MVVGKSKVVVAVGFVLSTILLGAGIGKFLFNRRKKRQSSSDDGDEKEGHDAVKVNISMDGGDDSYQELPRAPPPTRSGSNMELRDQDEVEEDEGTIPSNPPPSRNDSEACYDPVELSLINQDQTPLEEDDDEEEEEEEPVVFLRPQKNSLISRHHRHESPRKSHKDSKMNMTDEVAAAVSFSLGAQGYHSSDNDISNASGAGDTGHIVSNGNHIPAAAFTNGDAPNGTSDLLQNGVHNPTQSANGVVENGNLDNSPQSNVIPSGDIKSATTTEDIVGLIEMLDKNPQGMTQKQAVTLTNLLSTGDSDLLQKLLVSISNSAAFTKNQDLLREAGCLDKLTQLLSAHKMGTRTQPAVVAKTLTAVNNLSANEKNQVFMKDTIPTLIEYFTAVDSPESVQLSSLQVLTNLSVASTFHEPYTKVIQHLYECLDHGSPTLQKQSLKVLVNLSTNPDMVPHLLAAKAPGCLLPLLTPTLDEQLILRWLTFLGNVMTSVSEHDLSAEKLPTNHKAASPETMHTALYGSANVAHVKSKVFVLSKHGNADVRHHAMLVYNTLV